MAIQEQYMLEFSNKEQPAAFKSLLDFYEFLYSN